MRVALYARVSTRDGDQNPDIQLEAMRKYCSSMDGWTIVREYVDEASAVDFIRRKAWSQLMKDASLHKFDLILVWRLDRAFRDVFHGANTLGQLRAWNVGFRSQLDAYLDTTTPYGEALYHIINAFSQSTRATIQQNVQRGMEHAKEHGTKSGKPIGRKPANIDFTIICKALRETLNADGSPHYSNAARKLEELTGLRKSPGFIHMRISRRADQQPSGRIRVGVG